MANSPVVEHRGNAISVALTTHLGDGQTFRAGDTVSFLLSLDQDAYLLLIYQDAAGNLLRIFPDTSNPSGFVHAGQFVNFPFKGSSFRMRVTAPFGEETLWVFAASSPFPALAGHKQNDGAVILEAGLPAVLAQVREHGQGSGIAYGEARARLVTEPGSVR